MKLRLERTWPLLTRTIGRLYVNDVWECFTCEDRIRTGPKVYGETAIPYGSYKIEATWSPKFGRKMPEVMGVKGFQGVRLHAGNDETDSLGCILVGYSKDSTGIADSRAAAKALEAKILAALASGDTVTLDIVDPEKAKAAAA